VLLIAPFDDAAHWFQFDRTAIAAGQHWRWITGHFVHWTASHLCWDWLVFALLTMWIAREHTQRYLLCVAASAAAISLGVWLWQPNLASYRGLSGIDSALFAWVALAQLRQAVTHRQKYLATACGLALVGFLAKTDFEWRTGQTLFVQADPAFVPVPLTHIIGALVGVAAAGPMSCQRVGPAISIAARRLRVYTFFIMKQLRRLKPTLGLAAAIIMLTGCTLFNGKKPAQNNPPDDLPNVVANHNPKPTTTDRIAEAPAKINGYAMDGMIGQVNGRAIYAADILEPIHEQLQALGRKLPRDVFQQHVQEAVVKQLRTTVINSLVYGEAERDLSDTERGNLAPMTRTKREELLRQWGSGSLALAEENILRKTGLTLDQHLKEFRQQVVVSTYMQRKLLPRINVTRKDVKRYYRDHPEIYQPPTSRTVRMIQVATQKEADAIAALLHAGQEFAQVAATPLNQFKPDVGGLFGPVIGNAPLAMKPLNQAMLKLKASQHSQAIIIDQEYWFIYGEKIDHGQHQTLAMAQLQIAEALRRQQFQTLQASYSSRMFAQGSYYSLENMALTLVEIAMNRYAVPVEQP
jgi:rhomboid family GlyGly-CTERM serine protease